jgi:MFS family permease
VKVALAPLAQREYRLLFCGRVISSAGSTFALVALPFAVLRLTHSTTDVGLVVACRALPQVAFMLVGGIWADRLPRHAVMVGSNLLSATAQGITAALLLSGSAHVWELAVLQAAGGTAFSFFLPASGGLLPQTVPGSQLQEANALMRLAMNLSQIGSAAAAGFVVAGVGPGWAIAVDAASFVAGASCLAPMRIRGGERIEAPNFLRELALGWQEFRSRTWLWVIVVAFAFMNAVEVGSSNVLGPVVAARFLDGAKSWGLIVTAQSVGLIAAGLVLLRWRPSRMLFVGVIGAAADIPLLLLLAIHAPVAAIASSGFVMGLGYETFAVMWDTTMQQEIPQDRLSRVYSYDALGSFVFIPIGAAAAGPIASLIGLRATLWGCAALVVACGAWMLAVGDVRTLRRRSYTEAEAPAATAS